GVPAGGRAAAAEPLDAGVELPGLEVEGGRRGDRPAGRGQGAGSLAVDRGPRPGLGRRGRVPRAAGGAAGTGAAAARPERDEGSDRRPRRGGPVGAAAAVVGPAPGGGDLRARRGVY